MPQVAPPTPQSGHHQRPRRSSRRSRFAAHAMITTALITAMLICAAAILMQWGPLTARSGKHTVAVKRSPPVQIYEVPPPLPGLPPPKPTPTHTRHPPAVTPMPSGVPGDWTLKFDGEFNGTSLDTTKWSTGWYGSGITAPANSQEDDCYDPAQVTEGGGVLSLALTQKTENCGIADPMYAAGLVSTMGKFNFTYGFIEARVWLPGVPGHPGEVANWPGVWADGQDWPEDGEIDIAEGISGQVCAHLHNAPDPEGIGAGGGSGCPRGAYTDGWHTFAANWEPGSITYYYDGVDIGRVTSGVTSAPMFLVLDYAAQGSADASAAMKVEYMRVWQHP
jgi:beta-glucanase (GH16 family)